MPKDYKFVSPYGDFDISHVTFQNPDRAGFELHTHDDRLEIILFIRGNCEFRVEGTTYEVKPYDIIIVHESEMHIMFQKKPIETYERLVIHVRRRFFYENNCEEFLEPFLKRPLGVNNIIPSHIVRERNLQGVVSSIDAYIEENDSMIYTALKGKVFEILYNLNRIATKREEVLINNDKIKDIIMYINDNIKDDLSLDMLAERFYISKYHLCHIFKAHSGLTVTKYINRKRIMIVRELVMSGMSLTDASMEAGFGNYSDFYRAYVKETGVSPKNDLKGSTR